MQKFLYTIFITSICLQLTASTPAEIKSVTQEQRLQWPCENCLRFISIDHATKINSSEIDLYSQPLKEYYQDALVLIKNSDNTWGLGLIDNIDDMGTPSGEGPSLNVHVCKDHTTHTMKREDIDIRELLPYWQFQWQHRTPIAAIRATIMSYITRFERKETYPVADIKVINSTDQIHSIGDLHGSSKSVRKILKDWYTNHIIDAHCKIASDSYGLCLGDYEDRTNRGGEVWYMLATLKLINPERFLLGKGNHEMTLGTHKYNFMEEWKTITSGADSQTQMILLHGLFNTLPHAILLGQRPACINGTQGTYKFLLYCHGGPDDETDFDHIIRQAIKADQTTSNNTIIRSDFQFQYDFDSGLLWSDIEANEPSVDKPVVKASGRGYGMRTYNHAATAEFLEKQSHYSFYQPYVIEAMVRAHGHIPGGIVLSAKTITEGKHWIPLTSGQRTYIQRHDVFTCTSSPEALWELGCLEDSYATIGWDSSRQQYYIVPHIMPRIPRRAKLQVTQRSQQPVSPV